MVKFTKAELYERAESVGLKIDTYSPGDGVTRYRFFQTSPHVDYFASDGEYTAPGLKEASVWLHGYTKAFLTVSSRLQK